MVNKAVDKDNLRRTVRSYADSVIVHAGNAVSGGTRILQERIVILPISYVFIYLFILYIH